MRAGKVVDPAQHKSVLAKERVGTIDGMEVILVADDVAAVSACGGIRMVSQIASKSVRSQELKTMAESLVQTGLQRVEPARPFGFGKTEIAGCETLEGSPQLNIRLRIIRLTPNGIFRGGE